MLLENYLKNRNQKVVLNGLSFSWKKILAGVPQGSDLFYDISSICKIFVENTSLFSKVKAYLSLILTSTWKNKSMDSSMENVI